MDCPVCGYDAALEDDQVLVECTECQTIWLVSSDHLDRILVGAEG
jgi:hypothetical protein